MRIGIIGSSGGSALKAAIEIYEEKIEPIEVVVITDRDCGLAKWADERGFITLSNPYVNADHFSAWADVKFDYYGCREVLLFYTRRVAPPLINNRRVWNIHPALLPAFPGLHGLEDARRAGVSLFGATLHRVDDTLDTGPIDAQICSPAPPIEQKQVYQRVSYTHKVWLTLVWLETLAGRRRDCPFSFSWQQRAFLGSTNIDRADLRKAFCQWVKATL